MSLARHPERRGSSRKADEGFRVVTAQVDATRAVIEISGELDMFTLSDLVESLAPYEDRVERYIFDLGGVTFVDVVGFKPILERCSRGSGRIASLSSPAQRLLDLVGSSRRVDTRGWLMHHGEA